MYIQYKSAMGSTSDLEAFSFESEKAHLLSAISSLNEKIASAVKQAREDFKAAPDVYEFMNTKNIAAGIRKLFIMPLYIECFKSLKVKTRAELEQLWAKQYADSEVRETVEELLENEDSVREFAMEVDKELTLHEKKSSSPAKVGQALPSDMMLTDAETGRDMPLETCWKESKFTWFVFLRHFG